MLFLDRSTADWSNVLRHQPPWVGCSLGANKVLLASWPDEKSEWFYLSTPVRKPAQIIHKFKLSYQLPLAGMWRSWQELSFHSAVQNRANNLCSASLLWKMLGELLFCPFVSIPFCQENLWTGRIIGCWDLKPGSLHFLQSLSIFPHVRNGSTFPYLRGLYRLSFHAPSECVRCSCMEQLSPCRPVLWSLNTLLPLHGPENDQ